MENINKVSSKNKFIANTIGFSKNYPTVPIIIVLVIAFSILSPFFLSFGNAQTIMAANVVVLIAAIGETFVLLTGGIDLSVSTVISASAVVSGIVMAQTQNIFLGIVVAIAVGALFGLINGVLIGYFKMTPFITTMGTQLIAKGIAYDLSKGIAVKGTPGKMIDFGFSSVLGIPSISLVGILLLIISSVVLTQTNWGREVILFGSNRESARYTGIKTKRVEMSVYLLAGLLAGVAGFISIANLGNAIPGVGDTLLLIIIGGVVLGGTSMSGGEGSVVRTLIGIGLLAILTNGLNLISIPFYDQLVIQGVLIFAGNGLANRFTSRSPMAMK